MVPHMVLMPTASPGTARCREDAEWLPGIACPRSFMQLYFLNKGILPTSSQM